MEFCRSQHTAVDGGDAQEAISVWVSAKRNQSEKRMRRGTKRRHGNETGDARSATQVRQEQRLGGREGMGTRGEQNEEEK